MSTSSRPVSRRHQMRLRLGRDAIFSVAQAAELLPMADAEAVRWMEEEELVVVLNGRRLVIWGDVQDCIRMDGGERRPAERRVRRAGPQLRRVRLD